MPDVTNARVLGLITGLKGSEIAASTIVMQNTGITTTINKSAEAYDEDGACSDEAAVSVRTNLSFDGFVNAAITLKAGYSVVTFETKTYIVDNVDRKGVAGQYQTVSVTAHRLDNASPVVLAAPAS